MNPLTQIFEDFGEQRQSPASESAPAIDEADLEGQKLDAFENGFKAGWDDAIKAQANESAQLSSALSQHLQDLSFTYHEASNHMVDAVSPLLNEMINVLLPEMAKATIGVHLFEKIKEMTKEIGSVDVNIAVSPENVSVVNEVLSEELGFPVIVVADDTLSDEQADIRFGSTEKQIDLGDLVASVKEAVAGFTHDNRRKLANG
ncbi:ABC transporter ATP-binding protein [Pacificoceanicola onchidii]|uniref:ABC transporter ATP-binding protein n=1 Tax=Pacificoceanicola onchidii TaxID=2562685 RepID=UPI0010A62BC9|nr:ABC transporter ATP-binding protein [Pacificoceanicola onchidii]